MPLTPRAVVRLAIEHRRPPYVPWSFGFTHEARAQLHAHYGTADLETVLHNHLLGLGDDWGQQRGVQMRRDLWRRFVLPVLRRMYAEVRQAGKAVFMDSCGDVDELFDELVAAGVNCFNPFQPEVMDVWTLLPRYRGKLAFHGGLSTQKTLPFGTVAEVRAETRRLLELGAEGGYILAPAHAVEGDVPLENMLAFIDEAQAQGGWMPA